ncbi:MAG: L-serine ammonia-lyase, iron-sulfur-dependent, subunit alpha [Negativicutes bacterium]
MEFDNATITKVLAVLNEEIVPAEGCTEPIALAYVAAKAREVLGCLPERMKIFVSGNIVKNVKSVVVPNSGGRVGIEVSAAMGAIAGRPEKQLMVIQDITPEALANVVAFLKTGAIEVRLEPTDIKLYIRVELSSGSQTASVEVKHLHTNITKISKDGKILVNRVCTDADFNSALTDRKFLSIELIYNLAKNINLELIRPLFEKVIKLNSAIAEEGLKEIWGVNLGSCIVKSIRDGVYGYDRKNVCASFAAAGSDARMSGCPLPVMTTSGSGNQGMAASLPLIKYCQEKNIDGEQLIRGLFFSHLATVHIKTNVGRLSAHCGVVCASAAVSGAIALLDGEDYPTVANAIINTLGNIAGMICDGAKASCAMKIATGVYSAFDGAMLAQNRHSLQCGDGIVGCDVEATIRNIGELSQLGMQVTDEVILDIMTHN